MPFIDMAGNDLLTWTWSCHERKHVWLRIQGTPVLARGLLPHHAEVRWMVFKLCFQGSERWTFSGSGNCAGKMHFNPARVSPFVYIFCLQKYKYRRREEGLRCLLVYRLFFLSKWKPCIFKWFNESLYKKRRLLGGHREEDHVMAEQRLGMMCLQTKDHQGVPAATGSWERQQVFLLRAFRGRTALQHLGFLGFRSVRA